jgi:hypothetical protein
MFRSRGFAKSLKAAVRKYSTTCTSGSDMAIAVGSETAASALGSTAAASKRWERGCAAVSYKFPNGKAYRRFEPAALTFVEIISGAQQNSFYDAVQTLRDIAKYRSEQYEHFFDEIKKLRSKTKRHRRARLSGVPPCPEAPVAGRRRHSETRKTKPT